ncbi:hypothetical protein MML48_7g00020615 [Holotrichia oblita]|uniref:Uncharacterized protein n=1 Tax=Holotrichia oblita TaxID=644536 RepID=A0ACB9SVD6_HOLOL|nr:hypothetical protein MML48_7g00020615 [Holotrichia oblita]
MVAEGAMNYEKECEYLLRLFNEVETDIEPDDDDMSLTGDGEDIQDLTDDEQTIETIDNLDIQLVEEEGLGQQPDPGNRQVRTREENIIKFLHVALATSISLIEQQSQLTLLN